jgi:hypothetical protein
MDEIVNATFWHSERMVCSMIDWLLSDIYDKQHFN